MPATHCTRGHELRRLPGGRTRCDACESTEGRRARARERGRHPNEKLLTVSNAPFRERFVEMRARGECDAATLARALGWMRPPTRADERNYKTGPLPDTQRVMRTLGLADVRDRNGVGRRKTVSYELGVQMLGPLGLEPHEAQV